MGKKSIKAKLEGLDRHFTAEISSVRESVKDKVLFLKELTDQTAKSAQEAIIKNDDAQTSYRETHNDLIRKGEVQAAATIPRVEADRRFEAIEDRIREMKTELEVKINSLNVTRGFGEGVDKQIGTNRTMVQWGVLVGVALLSSAITLLGVFVALL